MIAADERTGTSPSTSAATCSASSVRTSTVAQAGRRVDHLRQALRLCSGLGFDGGVAALGVLELRIMLGDGCRSAALGESAGDVKAEAQPVRLMTRFLEAMVLVTTRAWIEQPPRSSKAARRTA